MRDFGATNRERTCLWCGRTLPAKSSPAMLKRRVARIRELYSGQYADSEIAEVTKYHEENKDRYGINEHFCTGMCAELFGLRVAALGYRLTDGRPLAHVSTLPRLPHWSEERRREREAKKALTTGHKKFRV